MPPRAKLPPGKGKRVPLNMRTTHEVRNRLEKAAAKSGRSLIQEVETRVEQSFLKEDANDRLRQGTLGDVYDSFGGYQTYTLMQLAAQAITVIEQITGKSWRSDQETLKHVKDAIPQIFAAVVSVFPTHGLPEGGPEHPGLGKLAGQKAGEIAREDAQRRFNLILARALRDYSSDRSVPPPGTPKG